jgi:DNA-binding IclR family transcriptional regulator
MDNKQNEGAERRGDGGIQVIARVGRIMRALSAHPQGLSLGGIASEVNLPRSTVQRIIYALEKENMVERGDSSGSFRIGPALSQMLYQTQADVVSVLRPHLERLSLQHRETVCLSRLNGWQIEVLEQFVGEQPLRIVVPMGMPVPFIICADVKALLARMDDEQIEAWTDGAPQPKASKSKLRKKLLESIAQVRQCGIACDFNDPFDGVASIACAIGTFRGAYAISLLLPSSRMPQKQDTLIAALKETRDAVERLVSLSTSERG